VAQYCEEMCAGTNSMTHGSPRITSPCWMLHYWNMKMKFHHMP